MLLPTFVSYALLLRLAACQFPGPQQVQTNQNGVEVWRAQRFPDDTDVIEYTVRDHGTMRPTLVYNCAKARSLCRAVARYFGGTAGTGTFHYDNDYRIWQGDQGQRKSNRRNANCASNRIEDGRCPETDQPNYYAGKL